MRSSARSDGGAAAGDAGRQGGRRRPRDGARGDGGQAAVELALGFPLVCVGLLLLVQVAVVVRAQVAVVHAAREAARAAAVSADPAGDGRAAAVAALPALAGAATIDIRAGPVEVAAVVRYAVRTDVPLVGMLVPDVVVEGRAVMQTEP